MEKIILRLKEIKTELKKINDHHQFAGIHDRVKAIIIRQFGEANIYNKRLKSISDYRDLQSMLYENSVKLNSLIDLVIDDIELSSRHEEILLKPDREEQKLEQIQEEIKALNKKIFIVHGHNDSMKISVSRIIEKLKLDPIILHEQPNQGFTIIEKFLSNSNVGFAIILLSADDMGYSKKDGRAKAKERARQNVIYELGYFTAKLGRKRVIAIVENSPNFETPSDIQGVIYIPFDGTDGKWKYDVAKELMESGYDLEIKNII